MKKNITTADKDHFSELAVTAIMRLKGTGNLESIHIIKKPGGALKVGVFVWGVCLLNSQTSSDVHIAQDTRGARWCVFVGCLCVSLWEHTHHQKARRCTQGGYVCACADVARWMCLFDWVWVSRLAAC